MENPIILKVGVATFTDAKHLFKDYLCEPGWNRNNPIRGLFELSHLGDMAECKIPNRSLKGMSEEFLGVSLDKNFDIRCSDWEADTLSNARITYAATDAMVAIELFKCFGAKYNPNSTFRNDCNRIQKAIEACYERNNED